MNRVASLEIDNVQFYVSDDAELLFVEDWVALPVPYSALVDK